MFGKDESITSYALTGYATLPTPSFGVVSALVKGSKQFKQREKRLLKVVTVNLPLYKQLKR
jgi:hypothetical protein